MHEKYDFPANDIALIKLKRNINFNEYAAPIPIASHEPKPGTMATVSGWGTLRFLGRRSDFLMKTTVPIVDRAICSSLLRENISNDLVCAGYDEGGRDGKKKNFNFWVEFIKSLPACNGDSGGPLAQNGELIGVVSGGYGCAEKMSPGFYANVFYFKKWIETNMKEN